MDDVERDNARHRREEQERKAKRQKNRETKSKSTHQSEKERKRKEHAQRILGAQKHQQSKHHSSKSHSHSRSSDKDVGGSSVFQALFHERAEGFFIDLQFRNAPPRPPVGPAFVGLGLEGELTNKWTKYKARNAVENQYSWKIHPDRDLGVPLAVSAMDFEGCYTDPAKSKENYVLPAMHPDDDALINWKGSTGDTAAEQLQQKQDRVRAAARLAIAQGYGAMPSQTPNNNASRGGSKNKVPGSGGAGGVRLKKHHLKSRLLDEALPNFMKKTTYLTNTATSVHQFTSLAHTQVQRAKDVDKALAETKTKYTEMDVIDRGFKEANGVWGVGKKDVDASGKKRRMHPTKKDVYPVWDIPLLPDVPTWGHTFTHVVLDHPPKNVGTKATTPKKNKSPAKEKGESFKSKQLEEAIVADVMKDADNARMACTVWVPKPAEDATKAVSESEEEPPKKKSKHGKMYGAVQQYDLDVVPLRDPSKPPVHYVWTIDPFKKCAGYHAVGSRVQLSTGRPIVVSGSGKSLGNKIAEIATDASYILHKPMKDEEKKSMDMKMAEVDLDLAEKYGLTTGEDGMEGEENSKGREALKQKKTQQSQPDSESDEIEADAF